MPLRPVRRVRWEILTLTVCSHSNALEDLKGSTDTFYQTLSGDGWMQSQNGNGSLSSTSFRRISSSDETSLVCIQSFSLCSRAAVAFDR